MSTYGSELSDMFNRAGGFVSAPAAAFAGVAGQSYIVPIIAGVVVIALIIMIVFIAIQMNVGKPAKLIKGPVDLYEPKPNVVIIDRPTAKSVMAATYTLAFYVRIDAVPDMRAGATPLLTWPGCWHCGYNAANEKLVWTFQQTPDTEIWAAPEPVTIPQVPLQRWTQITVGFEGRTADFYVNGNIVSSYTLNNMPPSVSSSVSIVPGGAIGQLAYVQAWPRRLTVAEVAENYTDTSDSQGRPFLGPGFFSALQNIKFPNLFCPSGNCDAVTPTATQSQTWEFPYA